MGMEGLRVIGMSFLHKGIGFLANALAAVTAAMVLFFLGVLLVPRFFGYTPYIVLSGSMEPVIHTGSLVYITELEDEPDSGDIVAYDAGDGMAVVHRIIGVSDLGYVTKGDANEAEDMKAVRPSQLVGRYAWSMPGMGYLLSAVESHRMAVGPVSVPAPIVIAIGLILMLNLAKWVLGEYLFRE